MDMSKFFQSKTFKIVTWFVAGLIILLFVFKLGVFVGYKKAAFSYRWGENYHRNFGGPRGGFFGDFLSDKPDFIESHGVFGQIIKITENSLVVRGQDNVEKVIAVSNDTIFERLRETIKLSDLKVDDSVVIIGRPTNEGQIEAKLIRFMPLSQTNTSSTPFMKRMFR